jgi:CelD/BcsL family acetyltransferase involved in cellulose biosynthesis
MLTINKINTRAGFEDLRSTWASILAQSGNDGIFLTWEWMKTWWDIFGAERDLWILLGYDGEELIGIAPLMRTTTRICGIPLRSIELIGSGYESLPDHLSFIARSGRSQEFAGAVVAHLRQTSGWDIIRLRDMREDPAFTAQLGELAPCCRYTVTAQPEDICPYTPLPGTWEEFQSGLSAEFRYAVKRKERNLGKKYASVFEIISDPTTLAEAMGELETIHKKRMQEKKESGSSLSSRFWEFHRRIASIFLEKGWLLLGVLKVEGRIVAGQYAFQYGGKAWYYQSGIDPDFGRFGVGVIMIAHMIRQAIEHGLHEYDFLRGNEAYKRHWTTAVRHSSGVIIWGNACMPVAARIVFSARDFVRQVWRRGTHGITK